MLSLGFEKGYVIQGGVGSKVAWVTAAGHAAFKAAHINFCVMSEPQSMSTIDELETRSLGRMAAFSKTGSEIAACNTFPSPLFIWLTVLCCADNFIYFMHRQCYLATRYAR